jgi:hypothetical protein
LEWRAHESAVFIRAADRELICYVSLVARSALQDGRSVRLGGIGGMKTHPAARRQGCAARAVRRAVASFLEPADIEFGLLVCEPQLIGYYQRLGWQEFGLSLLVTQRGRPAEFTSTVSWSAGCKGSARQRVRSTCWGRRGKNEAAEPGVAADRRPRCCFSGEGPRGGGG